MKTIRFWRIVLALVLLSGLLGAPLPVRQVPPVQAQGSNAVDVWYGLTPTTDGVIVPGEYAGANVIRLAGYGGTVITYVRHDTNNLYVAFDLPDTTPFPTGMGGPGPAVQVFLDTNNGKESTPQTDDYRLTITKGNTTTEDVGNGSTWTGPGTGGWSGAASTNANGWHAEFSIGFAKLGITPGTAKTIGFAVANVWTLSWPTDYYWPAGGYYLDPSTWGEAYSSEDWGSWYFKAGDWTDYAPSGVPDFDQKQDNWGTGLRWTYCGPVAAANSLWWFDSKFESQPQTPSSAAVNDHYPLVQTYGAWDDHWISNTVPLVDDLANHYGTNPAIGTNVYDMYYGTQRYLYGHGLYDDYLVTLAVSPTIEWVTQEVLRSEDVILLLGFYEWLGMDWQRVGGHYVTVAGVDPANNLIAFSDPYHDRFASGVWPHGGRIFSGTLASHSPIPGHGAEVHNDAGNVCYDYYPVIPTNSPGGVWGPGDYAADPAAVENFFGQNPHPTEPSYDWTGGFIQAEVEFAIAVSPFTWKPGEWEDYAPGCMPDFSQRQDGWSSAGKWTYCGPVAAANSLWWFDSKFEPDPVPPPTINDNYPLVQPYNPGGWDDHDPLNVETQAATIELVDDLAGYMGTGMVVPGTIITDLVNGTVNYIADRGLSDDYTVTQVHQPEWDWVVHEVTRCEDVVLLLGFWWYNMGDGMWYRYGGHYVTVAGVDPVAGLVGFSDPFFDQAELGWPWLGRVYPTGLHAPHPGMIPDIVHNDAAFLSHDVYRAVVSPSPGGKWGPDGYPAGLAISNFEDLNGPSGDPVPGPPPPDPGIIYTEVEWAMAVSPRDPDLVIVKDVEPAAPVSPGDWITYTLHYSNPTSNWATAVVITDEIPSYLASSTVTFTYTTNHGTIAASDAYVWDVGTLKYQQGGTITVTGQVDPSITAGSLTFTNTAVITATTADRDSANNSDTAVVTVLQPVLSIAKADAPDPVPVGDVITYTLTVQNTGGRNATGVTITDTIPANTTFRYADSGGSLVGNQVQWTGKAVNVSGSLTVRFSVTVTQPLPDGTILTNAAYGVTCAEGASASGTSVTTTVQAPVLSIAKADSPDPVPVGDVITYTLTVQNTGSGNATGVAITDTIPTNTTFRYADGGGSLVGSQVQWTGKAVNASGSLTVRFSVTVPLTTSVVTITNAAYGVTCAEGISAAGTSVTTLVNPYGLYLPLVMKDY